MEGCVDRRSRFDLIVGAGVLLQCTLLVLPDLRTARGLRNYLFAFGIGLLAFIPGSHEQEYDTALHLLFYFFLFAMATFWLFKGRLMPRVSESSVFVRSLVFWYLLLSAQSGEISWAIMAIAAVPTAGTLAVAFSVRTWSSRTALLMYVWFLVVTVAIARIFLRSSDLSYLSRAAVPDDRYAARPLRDGYGAHLPRRKRGLHLPALAPAEGARASGVA
jgi:ABC-type multidrug transport system fused ATPase/permease subunit